MIGTGILLPLTLGACAGAAEPDTGIAGISEPTQMQIESGDSAALAMAGRAALERQEYEGAAELLSRAVEARPDDPQLLSDLGIAYARMGQYSRGHEQLTGIMRLMEECADMCPQRQNIREAFRRLEGRLGVP